VANFAPMLATLLGVLNHQGGLQTHGSSRSTARRNKSIRATSSTSMTPMSKADLAVRPPTSKNIPVNVPKQVSNQIVYDVVKLNQTITAINGVVETNYAYSLGSHPQSASWAALFDQWCIPQFSVTFYSNMSVSSAATTPQFYTAIDFDNNTNITTLANIEDFSTCAVWNIGANNPEHTRSVKPCIKITAATTNNDAIARNWCDSAVPAIPWYGIRSMLNSNATTYSVTSVATVWYAFRNQI